MKISNKKYIDFSLLLFTIVVSGVPSFSTSILFLPLFIILLSVFIIRKRKLDKNFGLLILITLLLTFIQAYIFNFLSFQTTLGVFLRIINAYLVVKILGSKFLPIYISTLYYIALISFVFYIPILIVPSLGDLLLSITSYFDFLNFTENKNLTVIFYNLTHIESYRNSGPFWEPGAFAGYLLLAYIFNFIVNGNKKIRNVLLLAILTTLSTTAYLSLFVFLFFAYFNKYNNFLVRFFSIVIILTTAYYSYISFDFLGEKIEYQLSFIDQDPYLENTNTQRFLNILRDIEDFKGHEFFGRGSNPITRYSYELENQIRTVGITDILVRMGLIYFIIIFFMIYQSIKKVLNYYRIKDKLVLVGVFLTILSILMSEVYFNFPIFWCLLFLQFVYKTPKFKMIKNNNFSNEHCRITYLSQQER